MLMPSQSVVHEAQHWPLWQTVALRGLQQGMAFHGVLDEGSFGWEKLRTECGTSCMQIVLS